jgi:hypothetical protein
VFGLSWHDKRWRVLQEGGPDDEDGSGAARAAQAQTHLGMPIKRHFHTAVMWPDPASFALSSSSSSDDDDDDKKNKHDKKSKSEKQEKGKGKADEDETQEDGGDDKVSPPQPKMYVFGGKSNGYLNDLWAYDLGSLPRMRLSGCHHSCGRACVCVATVCLM